MKQPALLREKPHYLALDALRGVAALMVVSYHIFEGFATSPATQTINHGYLAVDFFFALSGFVIGYAYDDRWKSGEINTGGFFRRRLIRLHPMVVMGVALGVLTYCIQGCVQWDGTHIAPAAIVLAALLTLFMLPAVPGGYTEVRGNGEMFPLNGPMWSLFFEYIGNILYALFIRRVGMRTLAVLTALLGAGVVYVAVTNGQMGVGWTMAENGSGLCGGLVRMLFSYSAGMLVARVFRPVGVRFAFPLCAAALVVLFALPYAGTEEMPWLNGLYDSICIIAVFPAIVWVAASMKTPGKAAGKTFRALGDISYPLYVVHYPFYYLFYAWLWRDPDNHITFSQAWPVALVLVPSCVLLAWLLYRFYDVPVRRWLSGR